jgi:hypothetical protein
MEEPNAGLLTMILCVHAWTKLAEIGITAFENNICENNKILMHTFDVIFIVIAFHVCLRNSGQRKNIYSNRSTCSPNRLPASCHRDFLSANCCEYFTRHAVINGANLI